MRRTLLLLLALLLSFKAFAAGVVPIVGAPGHLHAASSVALHAAAPEGAADTVASATHVGCSGHPMESALPGDSLHEHSCPHLGMATASGSLPCLQATAVMPESPAQSAAQFSSVDLDVPSPPPNAIG